MIFPCVLMKILQCEKQLHQTIKVLIMFTKFVKKGLYVRNFMNYLVKMLNSTYYLVQIVKFWFKLLNFLTHCFCQVDSNNNMLAKENGNGNKKKR